MFGSHNFFITVAVHLNNDSISSSIKSYPTSPFGALPSDCLNPITKPRSYVTACDGVGFVPLV